MISNDLLTATENVRQVVNRTICRSDRADIGQFLTPAPTAKFMASLFANHTKHVKILDAGAGAGALLAACVQELCDRTLKPKSIEVVAVENNKVILPHLHETIRLCRSTCQRSGIEFYATVKEEDFITFALEQLETGLFVSEENYKFTHAILNPPYKKINSTSELRRMLDASGYGTSNLYSAFVWLSINLLAPKGEMVAITPRSFCNGPYFSRFRKNLLKTTSLRRIHVFDSRKTVFSEDAVLQENIIYHLIRNSTKPENVIISSTKGVDYEYAKTMLIPYDNVILPRDTDKFIHLVQNENDKQVMASMKRFTCRLETLGLKVSTGRVIEFRARKYIKRVSSDNCVPLIYPCHFKKSFIQWPNTKGKKPNAIVNCNATADLLLPSGHYVLTKRFTTKEERRRIVASVVDPNQIEMEFIGFENHINYFHANGEGLSLKMSKGLAVFLNSTLLDDYFRLFSGHTQVNATDLRKLRYPSRDELLRLGCCRNDEMQDQKLIDSMLKRELA